LLIGLFGELLDNRDLDSLLNVVNQLLQIAYQTNIQRRNPIFLFNLFLPLLILMAMVYLLNHLEIVDHEYNQDQDISAQLNPNQCVFNILEIAYIVDLIHHVR